MTIAIIGAIVTLLAALAPAFARWLKNRQDKEADPETARQRRINIASNDIATTQPGIAPEVSANGLADLDALERLRASASRDRK